MKRPTQLDSDSGGDGSMSTIRCYTIILRGKIKKNTKAKRERSPEPDRKHQPTQITKTINKKQKQKLQRQLQWNREVNE